MEDVKQKEMLMCIVREIVEKMMDRTEEGLIPVGVSNRHLHISKEDLEILFGKGYQLTKLKDLSQPGQYAAKETVKLIGPKGSFERVRILGPVRGATQVEISLTDGFLLGVNPPVKESGKIENTPGIIIEGPKGRIEKNNGVIAAMRHIHMPPQIAEQCGVKDKAFVDVEVKGVRKTIFGNVLVRVSDQYALEMHIDTDEANAGGLKNGDRVKILRSKE
ncbi:MAG: phosphate propanoyltransferase [Bacillota bacterium]